MSRVLAMLAAALIAAITISAKAGSVDDAYYTKRAQDNLQGASIWLIEEGIPTYRSSGKEGVHRKLVDEWAVQIWTDPWIESERFIDAFWIKARGIKHRIINFHRESLPSGIYEFWVVKVDGTEWSGVGSSAKFYVTRADNVYGRREILERSELFIEEFAVDGKTIIRFPSNDSKLLYELQAWRYPDHFCNSDIRNIRAEMKIDGTIELTRREVPCTN